MQRSADIGTGLYGGGLYLARWTIVDGYPRCPLSPLIMANTDAVTAAAAIAVNRAVATIAARAEAVEAAGLLSVREPPPEGMVAAGPNGAALEIANPDYAQWVAAGALVASAASDDDLQHLLRTRAGTLTEDEAPWALALPPVPDLNPLTQTADWDGAAWAIRVLTEEEVAIWPLRAPTPTPEVSREQFLAFMAGQLALTEADITILRQAAGLQEAAQ